MFAAISFYALMHNQKFLQLEHCHWFLISGLARCFFPLVLTHYMSLCDSIFTGDEFTRKVLGVHKTKQQQGGGWGRAGRERGH